MFADQQVDGPPAVLVPGLAPFWCNDFALRALPVRCGNETFLARPR
ncbi:MAG: hypothetical protein ACK559_28060 [bacterium]